MLSSFSTNQDNQDPNKLSLSGSSSDFNASNPLIVGTSRSRKVSEDIPPKSRTTSSAFFDKFRSLFSSFKALFTRTVSQLFNFLKGKQKLPFVPDHLQKQFSSSSITPRDGPLVSTPGSAPTPGGPTPADPLIQEENLQTFLGNGKSIIRFESYTSSLTREIIARLQGQGEDVEQTAKQLAQDVVQKAQQDIQSDSTFLTKSLDPLALRELFQRKVSSLLVPIFQKHLPLEPTPKSTPSLAHQEEKAIRPPSPFSVENYKIIFPSDDDKQAMNEVVKLKEELLKMVKKTQSTNLFKKIIVNAAVSLTQTLNPERIDQTFQGYLDKSKEARLTLEEKFPSEPEKQEAYRISLAKHYTEASEDLAELLSFQEQCPAKYTTQRIQSFIQDVEQLLEDIEVRLIYHCSAKSTKVQDALRQEKASQFEDRIQQLKELSETKERLEQDSNTFSAWKLMTETQFSDMIEHSIQTTKQTIADIEEKIDALSLYETHLEYPRLEYKYQTAPGEASRTYFSKKLEQVYQNYHSRQPHADSSPTPRPQDSGFLLWLRANALLPDSQEAIALQETLFTQEVAQLYASSWLAKASSQEKGYLDYESLPAKAMPRLDQATLQKIPSTLTSRLEGRNLVVDYHISHGIDGIQTSNNPEGYMAVNRGNLPENRAATVNLDLQLQVAWNENGTPSFHVTRFNYAHSIPPLELEICIFPTI